MTVCLLLCVSAVAAQEPSSYEYLKPTTDASNNEFNQVYYKTELDGVSVIGSMTMEGAWLVFNFVFKNQSREALLVKLPDMVFIYQGRNLMAYEGADIANGRGQEIGLGLNPAESECRALSGEVCLGKLYIMIPENFKDGSKITLQIPVAKQMVETDFIYSQSWMTGDSYREKVARAKSEGKF